MIRVNRLIINADDFGIHEAVNEGIYSAYGQGVLTSTSLLAQGPAFDDAVRMSKECNRLGIGIHLCLVGSLPTVLSPREVPSLVESDGLLPDNYMTFIKRVLYGENRFFSSVCGIIGSNRENFRLRYTRYAYRQPPAFTCLTACVENNGGINEEIRNSSRSYTAGSFDL